MLDDDPSPSPIDLDFLSLAACCSLACRVSLEPAFCLPTVAGSITPTTFLFGVLKTSSSSLLYGEDAADDETSPRCICGFERDRLRLFVDDDGFMMSKSG